MLSVRRYKVAVVILAITAIIEALAIFLLLKGGPQKTAIEKPVKPPAAIKGQIAIVIDDWGYNLNNLELIKQISYPLTISILPHLGFSSTIANELHRHGFEVMLHLPMEPHEAYRLEQKTLMASMTEAQIEEIIEEDLESVFFVKGVNNHMGSKATENTRFMQIICKQLKKRRLYLLDSLVTSKSVSGAIAKQYNIPFARRDIFLDNKDDPGYIKQQLYKLKSKARLYGKAIGIGHDRRTTIEVLKEMLPLLEREGFRLTFVSHLAKP